MQPQEDQAGFDQWAATYDHDVAGGGAFPFAGYDRVLTRVVALAAPAPGRALLELGPGTGNLTARLLAGGAAVWAVDFSAGMLARARAKAPAATFVQANLLARYPAALRRRYDAVVATYVLHEFPDDAKLALLQRLAAGYLRPGGRILIGDIGFPTATARDAMRRASGDAWDEEHYWIMDDIGPRLRAAGYHPAYEQLSSCGLVLALTP